MILKNIRALRIKRCETILDMAERLNMRITVLSAIENGKIKIPDNFLENLFGIYNFTSKEKDDFITKELLINDEEKRKFINMKKWYKYSEVEDEGI